MKKNITNSKGFNISHIKWKTKLECSLTKTPKYTSKKWYELCLAPLLKSPSHVFVVEWGMVGPVPHRVPQNTFSHPNFVSLSGLKAFWLKKRRIRPRICSVHNDRGDLFNVAAGDGLIVSANLSLIPPPESDTPEIVDDRRLLSS